MHHSYCYFSSMSYFSESVDTEQPRAVDFIVKRIGVGRNRIEDISAMSSY